MPTVPPAAGGLPADAPGVVFPAGLAGVLAVGLAGLFPAARAGVVFCLSEPGITATGAGTTFSRTNCCAMVQTLDVIQ